MYELYTTKTFERRLKSFLKKHPELEYEGVWGQVLIYTLKITGTEDVPDFPDIM